MKDFLLPAPAVALVLAGAALYTWDPAKADFFPLCPLHATTGMLCAGCGTLRALHRLLHGDLAGALRMNSLMVVFLPFLLHGLWATWRHERTGRPMPAWTTSSRAGLAILGILVTYVILRNLPWYPFNLLAPP